MTATLQLEAIKATRVEMWLPSAQLPLPLWSEWRGLDRETSRHSLRLAGYAVSLGRRLRLNAADLEAVRLGSLVHDIGKLAIPASILNKPAALEAHEWEIVRQHPILGERLCAPIRALQPALGIVRHHHERWDGSGYPDHLAGERIPLGARVVQLLDIFDALTSARPYKPAWSILQSLAIMQSESDRGILDPRLFREFSRIVR